MRSTGIDGKVSPQPIYAHLITPKPPPPRNPGRASLDYFDDGIWFAIREGLVRRIGLIGIARNEDSPSKPFRGQTPEGISVASNRKEVEQIFGKPEMFSGFVYKAYYDTIGMRIHYDSSENHSRIQIIEIFEPRDEVDIDLHCP
jgi:hypothetical protein